MELTELLTSERKRISLLTEVMEWTVILLLGAAAVVMADYYIAELARLGL